jgi:ammonia channel protein AmtB
MAADNPVAPTWLNNGDHSWQLTAGSLVALQSLCGLGCIYAGLVQRKWVVNSLFMVFYAFSMVLIIWSILGYNISFGEYMLPFAGIPKPILGMHTELKQSTLPSAELVQAFPLSTMVYFQFAFAAITLVLIAGAYLARMNPIAWMIFVPLYLLFSYCVGAYSIWGGGFLFKMGVLDYSGGYVIHLSSGTAAFTGAWWIGPRLKSDRENSQPNNIPLAMIGSGILWVGWNGFNGGVSKRDSSKLANKGIKSLIVRVGSVHCVSRCRRRCLEHQYLHGNVIAHLDDNGHHLLPQAIYHRCHERHDHRPSRNNTSCRLCSRLGRYHNRRLVNSSSANTDQRF